MKTFGSPISWVYACLAVSACVVPCRGGEFDKPPAPAEIARDRDMLRDAKQPPEARAAAAARLRKAGITTADATILADLLKSIKGEPDPQTRIAIINAAIGIVLHNKMALPLELVEPILDPSESVRNLTACYVSLAGSAPTLFGPPSVEAMPLLLKALRHDDAGIRSSAVLALSHIRVDQKVVLPELRNAMHDRSYRVRNNATVEIWRMTKQADVAIPAFAALAGSKEPLEDHEEECIRNLASIGFAMRVETIVKEKPNEVSAELLLGLHSRSEDIRRGSALLLTYFLKGQDETLKVKRESVRQELHRLAGGSDVNVRTLVKDILESADKPRPTPKNDQPKNPPAADHLR